MKGLPLLLAALALTACKGTEFEPPSREGQVEDAAATYSPALFDTVAWQGDEARMEEGNLVYAAECRECHGPLGRGGTDYARERDLDVPSLVDPAWEHGTDLEAVRRQIYVGHPEGMPTWGVSDISPREIDAVAYYLLFGLRPEVLGDGSGP